MGDATDRFSIDNSLAAKLQPIHSGNQGRLAELTQT